MSGRESVIYLDSKTQSLNISYFCCLPPDKCEDRMFLNVVINDSTHLADHPVKATEEVHIPIKPDCCNSEILIVKFVLNHTWRPCDVLDSADSRELGIAVFNLDLLTTSPS